MHAIVTRIAAARIERRRRLAEHKQSVWEERRRIARRSFSVEPFRFPVYPA